MKVRKRQRRRGGVEVFFPDGTVRRKGRCDGPLSLSLPVRPDKPARAIRALVSDLWPLMEQALVLSEINPTVRVHIEVLWEPRSSTVWDGILLGRVVTDHTGTTQTRVDGAWALYPMPAVERACAALQLAPHGVYAVVLSVIGGVAGQLSR
jgi:hypothetical protein